MPKSLVLGIELSMYPWQDFLMITEDGSPSILLPEHGEAMHARSGALLESNLLHVAGNQISQRLQSATGELCILDIGFGLGWNFLAACKLWLDLGKPTRLKIMSLEKQVLPVLFDPSPWVGAELSNIYGELLSKRRVSSVNFEAQIIEGDALLTLPELLKSKMSFDVFFQDPFSPKVNPELWDVAWFTMLRRLAKPGASLTTYSAAGMVKRNLTGSSWQWQIRPLPWKKESLVAFNTEENLNNVWIR